MMATRLYTPEQFSMTAGVNVPFDLALIEDLYDALPRRLGETRLTDLTDDRRFAETIYRVALADGIMDRVTTRIRPKTVPNRSGQTVVAACTRRVSAAGLTPSQAKLSRDSNQIARGRIRGFESYHPSHAVRSTGEVSTKYAACEKSDVSV